MTDINLTTEQKYEKKGFLAENIIPLLFVVLVLCMVAYGALVYYKSSLSKQVESKENQYTEEYAKLTIGNAKQVVDFQNRMDAIENVIKTRPNVVEGLQEIEKRMVSGVYVKSYEYSAATNQIVLVCATNNYRSVAEQILAFKGPVGEKSLISGVTGGETSFNLQEGRIEFKIVISLS